MRICLWTLVVTAAAGAAPGTVEGTVSNFVTGVPVKRALVTLRSTAEYAGYQVTTDAGGRFRIADVKSGKYAIYAAAQGYVSNVPDYNLDPPPGNAVSVADDQSVKDVALRLIPFGAIAGRVLDETGEPIADAAVEALRYEYSRYGKALRTLQTVKTNDRGEYRLFDVAPGRWYLEISKYPGLPPVSGRRHSTVVEEGYPPTFYPGPVEMAPGNDIHDVDFRLRKARVYHVRGKTAAGAWVGIYRCDDDRAAFNGAKTDSSGMFDFKGVSPGCYLLAGELQGQTRQVSAVQRIVVVDRDLDDVAVRLAPAFALQGVAMLEEASPEKMQRVIVVLETTAPIPGEAYGTVAADGTFTLANLAPASYRVRVQGTRGLYLKSIRLGNTDVSGDGRFDAVPGAGPLTLVLSGDGGAVSGVATPAPTWLPLRITIAPDSSERLDLVRLFEPGESGGRFHAAALAPGNYKVLAWQTADEALVDNAEFRHLFDDRAAKVTVSARGQSEVNLTVITAAEIEAARGRLK